MKLFSKTDKLHKRLVTTGNHLLAAGSTPVPQSFETHLLQQCNCIICADATCNIMLTIFRIFELITCTVHKMGGVDY